jgi:hypothetical protein
LTLLEKIFSVFWHTTRAFLVHACQIRNIEPTLFRFIDVHHKFFTSVSFVKDGADYLLFDGVFGFEAQIVMEYNSGWSVWIVWIFVLEAKAEYGKTGKGL